MLNSILGSACSSPTLSSSLKERNDSFQGTWKNKAEGAGPGYSRERKRWQVESNYLIRSCLKHWQIFMAQLAMNDNKVALRPEWEKQEKHPSKTHTLLLTSNPKVGFTQHTGTAISAKSHKTFPETQTFSGDRRPIKIHYQVAKSHISMFLLKLPEYFRLKKQQNLVTFQSKISTTCKISVENRELFQGLEVRTLKIW